MPSVDSKTKKRIIMSDSNSEDIDSITKNDLESTNRLIQTELSARLEKREKTILLMEIIFLLITYSLAKIISFLKFTNNRFFARISLLHAYAYILAMFLTKLRNYTSRSLCNAMLFILYFHYFKSMYRAFEDFFIQNKLLG